MRTLINKLLCQAVLVTLSIFLILSDAKCEDLSDKVSNHLEKLSLGTHQIDISNRGSKVTVSGYVASVKDKEAVIQSIRSMEGVEEVVDSLDIDSTARQIGLDDRQAVEARIAEVSKAVDGYLQGANLKGPHSLKYEMNEQGVLISGQLPAGVEKQALLYQVRRQVDTPVQENITVRPWPKDDELARRVRSELSEKQHIDLSGITISVSDGVVVLKGKRANHNEADQLAAAVLMVEGVRELKSEVTFAGTRGDP